MTSVSKRTVTVLFSPCDVPRAGGFAKLPDLGEMTLFLRSVEVGRGETGEISYGRVRDPGIGGRDAGRFSGRGFGIDDCSIP